MDQNFYVKSLGTQTVPPQAVSRVTNPEMVQSRGMRAAGQATSVSKQALIWDTGWVNLSGVAGTGNVSMPLAECLDAAGVNNLTVKLRVPGVSGAGLHLQHAMSLNGPWQEAIYNSQGDPMGFSGSETLQIVLSSSGGDREFTRYVRWEIQPTAVWQACFRIQAYVSR